MTILTRADLVLFNNEMERLERVQDIPVTNAIIDCVLGYQIEKDSLTDEISKLSSCFLWLAGAEMGVSDYGQLYPPNLPHFKRQFGESIKKLNRILAVHDANEIPEKIYSNLMKQVGLRLAEYQYHIYGNYSPNINQSGLAFDAAIETHKPKLSY